MSGPIFTLTEAEAAAELLHRAAARLYTAHLWNQDHVAATDRPELAFCALAFARALQAHETREDWLARLRGPRDAQDSLHRAALAYCEAMDAHYGEEASSLPNTLLNLMAPGSVGRVIADLSVAWEADANLEELEIAALAFGRALPEPERLALLKRPAPRTELLRKLRELGALLDGASEAHDEDTLEGRSDAVVRDPSDRGSS